MTPSDTILASARQTHQVVDRQGRRITVKTLSALDTLRLLKAAGPVLAENQPWLSIATLAISVIEIDQIPVPAPTSEVQIEAVVERLGDDGLEAIADELHRREGLSSTDPMLTVGNSLGTPS